MPDDWNMEFQVECYRETFDRAIALAKAYPDTLWCYGNHFTDLDLSKCPYLSKAVNNGVYNSNHNGGSASSSVRLYRVLSLAL